MKEAAELFAELSRATAPNWFDRQITRLSPRWGLSRFKDRAAMAMVGGGSWAGASHTAPNLMNWNPLASSPDDEQRYDRPWLINRATDLERSDALAGGAVAEAVLSVVGTGLALQPEPNRKILGWSQDQAVEWAEVRKQRFSLWAEDPRECDLRRRATFYQAQAIAYRTVASRGDAFVLLPRRQHPGTTWAAKFQIIEGDRCIMPPGKKDTATFNQGVETDDFGGFKSFWFCKRHPASGLAPLTADDFINVPAWGEDGRRLVLPLMHEHRLDLRRGYPLLAPVIHTLKDMSRLSDAELAAAVVSSFIAVVITKTGPGAGPLGTLKKDAQGKGFTELGPAMVAELLPGESITPVAPQRPNGAFDPFWKSLMGQIAMRLQIPPEVLLKKFESSYTAARAALLQFWKFVMVERENLLAPDFCQPLYEAWLAEDVAAGGTPAPGFFANPLLRSAYSYARWIGDNPPILDPLKEVLASQEMIDYTLSTHTAETMRLNGGDFGANVELATREVRLRREGGLITDLKPETFENATGPGAAPAGPADTPDPDEEDSSAPSGKSPRRQALINLALKED